MTIEDYLKNISEFLSERYDYPLSLSPRDVAKILSWYESGYSLGVVLDGITMALGGRTDRRAVSLSYCDAAVKKEFRQRP
jgi:hypothetical protein